MNSDEKSLSWADKGELFLERCVRYAEALIVIVLAIVILLGITYQMIWILWTNAECRQLRFAQSVKTINDNWKIALVILIPIFYRAIRTFLEKVDEAWGLKTSAKKKTEGKTIEEL